MSTIVVTNDPIVVSVSRRRASVRSCSIRVSQSSECQRRNVGARS